MKNDRFYKHFRKDDVTWFRYTNQYKLNHSWDFMFTNYFYATACGYSTLNKFLKNDSLIRLQFLRKLSNSLEESP
jgi:hypothetical protein